MIDSADRIRMDECGEELQRLLEDDKLAGVPILIFANKQDLLTALPADEIEETLHLSLISDRPWNIQACSASEGEGKHRSDVTSPLLTAAGLQEGMDWLVETIGS